MKKLLSILIFCLTFPLLKAQNPGFMGKKNVVGYGFYFSPALNGATATNKTYKSTTYGNSTPGYLRLNVINELFIEHSLSTKTTLGLSYRNCISGFDNRIKVQGYTDGPKDYYRIISNSLAFSVKKYRRHAVAPWGKYFMYGAYLSSLKADYDEQMYIVSRINGHDTIYNSFEPSDKRHLMMDVQFGFGNCRVIQQRILIDYGINSSIFSLLTMFSAEKSASEGFISTEYIGKTISNRSRGFNRCNVFIRVGYLF